MNRHTLQHIMTSFSLAKQDEKIDRALSTLMSCLVDQYENLPEKNFLISTFCSWLAKKRS